jgi:hypothetical protein
LSNRLGSGTEDTAPRCSSTLENNYQAEVGIPFLVKGCTHSHHIIQRHQKSYPPLLGIEPLTNCLQDCLANQTAKWVIPKNKKIGFKSLVLQEDKI